MEIPSACRPLGVLVLTVVSLSAQTPPAAPAFDVASIKSSKASAMREGGRRERIEAVPGSLIMGNVRFQTAVRWAYRVQEYQVTGPSWIGEERYDIVAKAGSPAPESDLRLMLQTLLAERFQLAIHHQTKEMNAYVVTVGKNGHKLQESKAEGAMDVKPSGPMVATIQRADLDELASMLSQPLQAPVVNMTGLKGRYDFKVDMAPYLTPEVMSTAKSPMDLIGVGITAMQEQLGLKMESKKVAVELIVVDHAEKLPIEN
jgi:uncharacterized protein (TIGR03435 family)